MGLSGVSLCPSPLPLACPGPHTELPQPCPPSSSASSPCGGTGGDGKVERRWEWGKGFKKMLLIICRRDDDASRHPQPHSPHTREPQDSGDRAGACSSPTLSPLQTHTPHAETASLIPSFLIYDDIELLTLLFPPFKCQEYWCAPPHMVYVALGV